MSRTKQGGVTGRRGAVLPGKEWLAILSAFAFVSFPLLYVQMPPVMDYPNHLARIWLLSGGVHRPPLSNFYVVEWSRAATNVAVDWLASQLSVVIGLSQLDRLIRLFMFLGPPAGAACLGRLAFGRWSVWHISALMFAWTTTALAGFMSYSISLCAALFAASLIYRRISRFTIAGAAIHLVLSAALLTIHPFGLLFYLALLTGIAIGPDNRNLITAPRFLVLAAKIAVLAAISFAVVIALFLLAAHPPSTSHFVSSRLSALLSPRRILLTLLSPVLTYSVVIDCLFLLPLVVLLGVAAWKKWLGFHLGLFIVAAVLGFASIVAPQQLGDATWLDRRLPLMAALTLVSALMPSPPSRRAALLFYGVLLSAVLGKALWVTDLWLARDRDLNDLLAVTSTVRPGDAIIVVRRHDTAYKDQPLGRYIVGGGGEPRPVRRHLPALLVPLRQAFIPTLFSIAGQQPLRVSRLKSPDAVSSSSIPFVEELGRPSLTDPYVARLHCDFQYVLLLGADEKPVRSPNIAGLRLVSASGMFSLYADEQHDPSSNCFSAHTPTQPKS